jgi:molecular chaperone GrpE
MTHPSDTPSNLDDTAGAAADAGPDDLEAALADAEARAQQHWNSYLRAVAETENVRKRAQRDLESASRYAVERFAGDLLEVRDSLELGLQSGATAQPERLLEGMEATLRLVNRAFEKAGVSVLDPAGQPFNPEFHEAIATQPSTEQPAGTVLAVVQKGYVLNGRLLRPARVLVARAPDPSAAHPDAN